MKKFLTALFISFVILSLPGCEPIETTGHKSVVAIQKYLDCDAENAKAIIREISEITGCNNMISVEIANGEYLPEDVTCILEFRCEMDEHTYYAFIGKKDDSYVVKRISQSN